MKAPAGRPGLDVLRGGERAAPRCRHLPAEARAAGRGPRAIKGRRAAGRAPPAGGARAAGGAQRLRLLINPGNRALPARHEGRSQGRRVGRPGVWPPSRGAPCAASAGEPEGPPTGRGARAVCRSCQHTSGAPRTLGPGDRAHALVRPFWGQFITLHNACRKRWEAHVYTDERELLSIPRESPSAGPAGSLLSRPREA